MVDAEGDAGAAVPGAEGRPAPSGRPPAGSAQAALDVAGAAVAVIDARGTVIGWTRTAEELLGYRAADVVDRSATRLLHSREAPDADADPDTPTTPGTAPSPLVPAWPARVRAGAPWSELAELRHREGHGVHVTLQASPLAGPGGRTDWFLSAAPLSESSARPTMDGVVVRSLLEGAPIGLSIWDADLRCVWLNSTVERQSGVLRHERLGRRVTESLPGFDTDAVEAAMLQVLRTGTPVIDHEFRWIAQDLHQERVFSSSFFRLDGTDGRPLGVCSIAVDITSSWARERLSVLSEAGTRIGTTLDVMNTAQELADVAVPLLADYTSVDLAEALHLGGEPLERLESGDGTIPVFRRGGVASIHEGNPESLWSIGEAVYVPRVSPFMSAMTTGKSQFEPIIRTGPGTWVDNDPGRRRVIEETGVHSIIVVPLRARGAVLGVAVFTRNDTKAPFSRDDLLLAEELAARASLSLDNALRYTRERTASLALQRNLLPRHLSGGHAVDVAARYLPADLHDGVGGDWFDVIPLSGGRVALVVGDVVGHGINAAATMGQLHTAVHTLADMDLPPDELLAHLDDLVVRLTEEDAEPDAEDYSTPVMGATCVYAVYDPVTRRCTMARAGHPPPAIVFPDGTVTFPELPAGSPIGLGLLSFQSVEMELPEGSVIALYTDGLVETREADIDVGLGRLGAALARTGGAGRPLEEVCAEVVGTMVSTAASQDDVALLLARTRSLPPDHVVTWVLPTDPALVANARALAVAKLSSWGLDQLAATVELIVSELVTNAVRYGAGPIRLRLIRHGALVCEVFDSDDRSPRLRHARAEDEKGWGLFLVAKLSHRWGTRTAPGGKIVWAELELPLGAAGP
ncbi:SpoIIE family protein phosphatase [Streptomyces sp. NPDC088261]|uniref:SpoIIE family protein phosphatase n=1 Tax=Streptomyces sp. NPDC088261 TaxID=3365851 RepID=UPI003808F9F9